jgi:hypothetical protein
LTREKRFAIDGQLHPDSSLREEVVVEGAFLPKNHGIVTPLEVDAEGAAPELVSSSVIVIESNRELMASLKRYTVDVGEPPLLAELN